MESWANRAVSFTSALERHTDRVTVNSCESDAPLKLRDLVPFMRASRQTYPEQIVEFLTAASSSCRCDFLARGKYTLSDEQARVFPAGQDLPDWYFHGVATLCNLEYFAEWMDAYTLVPEEYQDDWHESFIFMNAQQFDFLALDLSSNDNDPPVILLSHEVFAKAQIAPNFSTFLERWEMVHYLNPINFFEFGFIDDATDEFDPQPDAIGRLHQSFPFLDAESK